MNSLQLFTNALEERLNTNGTHRGTIVCRQNVEAGTFKAYKTYTQEVWNIDGSNKQLIAKVQVTGRAISDMEKENILENLYFKTIMEVLKYYGI